MTLAAYLRVSDASQVERYSLPAQRDMILAWCEREGLPGRDFGGVALSLPVLDTLPPEEQNYAARQVIDRVVILDKHARRIVYRPEALGAFDGCR